MKIARFLCGLSAILLTLAHATADDKDPKRIVIDAQGMAVPRNEIKSFDRVATKYEMAFDPPTAKRGQTVTLKISIQPIQSFWTYPAVQPEKATNPAANFENRFHFPDSGPAIFVGEIKDPANPKHKAIPDLDIKDLLYYPGPAEWVWERRKAIIALDAQPGEMLVELKGKAKGSKKISNSEIMICDDSLCHYSSEVGNPSAKLTILPDTMEIDPQYKKEVEQILAARGAKELPVQPPKETPKNIGDSRGKEEKVEGFRIRPNRDYQADLNSIQAQLPPPETDNSGFLTFILTAMFWGVVTLLTPCVFPMIPITVSYFLKQGEKKLHNPVAMASVYTLTIIIVLGISSVALLSAFYSLSVDPIMNLALGALFVFFAMSLFGMFEIRLPGFLAKFTSNREGGGYLGTVFMACSFTIVSFTCVAPFLGGFSGMAASGNFSYFQLALGGLAFATTFAAPFFLLALFPALLKKMPKSGSWMNTVKVVMGFLELAAALKFFRTAELRFRIPPAIFSYDFVLSMWVVLLLLCGLYLLNLYRLPHDYPQDNIGVPRMLFGFVCISIAVYLLPALFSKGPDGEKQRPGGTLYAWVDAFLLPEPSAAEVVKGDLVWSGDLLRSIEHARAKGQMVFIDFTGVTCSNCRLNEKNVFVKDSVKELFRKYQLVQVYTDDVPQPFYEMPTDLDERRENATANRKFQSSAFGSIQLPLYVILRPTKDNKIERVGIYREGKINSETEFLEFLRKPLQGAGG